MKYLDLAELIEPELALNFDTEDTHVFGDIEVYTLKAGTEDKKLYKRIENTLEKRYEEERTEFEALSPKDRDKFRGHFNLDRWTTLGTFKDVANRKKFAYLIATLNQAHTDYDFANTLKDDEFFPIDRKSFQAKVDQTLYYLRPTMYSTSLASGNMTPGGSPVWNFRYWNILDQQMGLDNCEFYKWTPPEDPFSIEGTNGGFLFINHYLIYSKERKRVAYFNIRGRSGLSSSPTYATSFMTRYKKKRSQSLDGCDDQKRAEYWLGKRGAKEYGVDDDLDDLVIDHDEVVDAEEPYGIRERELSRDYSSLDEDLDSEWVRQQKKLAVDDINEHITSEMEV